MSLKSPLTSSAALVAATTGFAAVEARSKPPASEPLAYSVREVLDRVPISRGHLYAEIAVGKLVVTKIGTRTLFTPQAALRNWLAGGSEQRPRQGS